LRRALAGTAAAAALAGCALQPRQPEAPFPPGLPVQIELAQVPFFAQDEFQCGPAALASALSFAGVARNPQQLVDQVYVPQRQGSLQLEMLAATRRAGLVAYPLPAELGALLRELAGGLPVVVLQNLRWDIYPRWHYAVLIGYDLDRHEWILRSGTQARQVVAERDFVRSWTKAGRWAFVAVPAGRLPAGATEDGYVAAVANLERVAPQAAQTAYELALASWPADLVARIGLGNIAYGQRRLAEAMEQYRRASEAHPESGDAWNNLAQVLHELGRDEEARTCAQRAIGIGGPRLTSYRATLQAIGAAPAP
jgi:tetratricopeptide (TPR) repeat protein